jgi:hypothetical protein
MGFVYHCAFINLLKSEGGQVEEFQVEEFLDTPIYPIVVFQPSPSESKLGGNHAFQAWTEKRNLY